MSHPEQQVQTQIAKWLDWALPDNCYYTAIGHGGGGYLRGAILRGMGVKRGVFDLLFLGPDRFIGWIEVKSDKGRLTPEQQAFAAMVESMGHRTAIARSIEDIEAALRSWGIALRTTKPSGRIIDSLRAAIAAQPPSG